jgi:2-keto-3-deoxy-L-fuconate dehydrogenase
MNRLTGKTVFATATGQGIGRACVLAFAAEGANVFATDINAGLLAQLAKDAAGLPGKIETFTLDARNTAAVDAAAKRVGTVNILLNCAGMVHTGTAVTTDEAAWDLSFDLNVKSQWRTLRAFLPAMIANGGGSVVNIASAAGSIKGAPNRYAYGATKAAVIGITKSVAVDFVKQGIRCNAICPGTVDTPSLNDRIQTMPGGPAENRKMFEARQPVGRFAQPEEVAHLAVWLASDESAFVTGGTHVIDGGWTV